MKTEVSVLIDRAIDDVFVLTTRDVCRWSEVVIAEETLEDRHDGGVGTTFRSICQSNGNQQMEFIGEVIQHDPPRLQVVRLKGDHFDIEAAYSFEAVDSSESTHHQTRVTQFSKVEGKGFFAFMLRYFGWLMQRASCQAAEKEMKNLKRYCEQATSVSSD